MVDKMAQLDDPRTMQLYRLIGELRRASASTRTGWTPWPTCWPSWPRSRPTAESWTSRARRWATTRFVALLDSFASDAHPMIERLQELMAERGWTGWSRIERVGRTPQAISPKSGD